MNYIPHTPEDFKAMMETVGIGSIQELFSDIPGKFTLDRSLDLPKALSEQELFEHLSAINNMNRLPGICLRGAGAYGHYIPAVVGHVLARSEFYTAYTPYQAEISQGILQAIYEYQTMIAKLTGMQVANASMYDGASAMAEAAVLAAKTLDRNEIVLARSIHPEYREVVKTYCWANGFTIIETPYRDSGRADADSIRSCLGESTAAVIVQSPNFFGVIEDLSLVAADVQRCGALLVAGFTEACSLGLLKPAGEMGADLVVGEGQSFGNPLNYGGPYLGIFASTRKLLRKIPGRLAGATVDKEGKRGFVLTLQTREQHIRRERATSNICSNEALCALAAAVYLASLGKNLRKLSELNFQKAQYLKSSLSKLQGWSAVFPGPVFNEFVMRCPDPAGVNRKLAAEGITGGVEISGHYPELGDTMLLCATEMLSRSDIDRVVSILKGKA